MVLAESTLSISTESQSCRYFSLKDYTNVKDELIKEVKMLSNITVLISFIK